MSPNPETISAPVAPAAEAAKPAGQAVIRRLDVLAEDANKRLLRKVAPAWAISGGIHVIILFIALLIVGTTASKAAYDDKVVTTAVEDKNDKDENFTNEDVGFDPDLAAATEAEREADKNIEAPVIPDIAVDAEKSEAEAPTLGLTGFADANKDAGAMNLSESGTVKQGKEGGFAASATTGFGARGSGATKDMLIRKGGGNSESEAAVARGLAWLSKQQREDGSWRFDGDRPTEVAASTGMAILPFLAAGITHKYHGGKPEDQKANKYVQQVAKGVRFLQGLVGASGKISQTGNLYGQGIATIALCEAVGMTKDKSELREKAQLAINYIVKAQGKDGGWRYTPGSDGDTSVVGWQVQALKSGILAELKVPKEAMDNAGKFLDKVASESGSKYGYTDSGTPSPLRSAVGLLCRQYVNKWGPGTPGLIKGVDDFVSKNAPTRGMDIYYAYYATQVVHFFEGPAWHQKWNPAMRDMLITTQNKMDDKDKNYGSWNPDGNSIGTHCGRLGCTCLSLLTLEVYYRHLPLNKRDDGGRVELDR